MRSCGRSVCFLLLMDSKLTPRVGRAWRPIRRVVHFGPRCINRLVSQSHDWSAQGDQAKGSLLGLGVKGEPVTAIPCWAPWWAVPSGLNPDNVVWAKKKPGPFSGQRTDTNSKRNNFPTFFVIQRISNCNETFHGVSPFLVEKAITGNVGNVKSTKKLRSGDLLVEVESSKQAKEITKLNLLSTIPVTVKPHATLNSSKGVISCGELLNESEEKVTEELKSQGVTQVRRITIRRDGQLLNTKHLILTFDSNKLPEHIKGEARKLIKSRTPTPGNSYVSAVKKSTAPSTQTNPDVSISSSKPPDSIARASPPITNLPIPSSPSVSSVIDETLASPDLIDFTLVKSRKKLKKDSPNKTNTIAKAEKISKFYTTSRREVGNPVSAKDNISTHQSV
ncbi:hypothetical protein AVEN_7611-1 [Araneus ventricosus]|uniref:Uncharacterized protein n=1 Tax=Araneus ventricosus TaxID=182803 RepID=A0A4Y2N272_ARAVE|nr:hypothetical protein AVEN_7611-1 [Araneus ventricosus]